MEKKNEANNAENLSNSMKKRIDRANQQKKAKRSAMTGRIISIAILALIAAGVIYLICTAVVKASYKVTPNGEYSKCLDANGYVSGVNASTCVTLPEYKGVSIPRSEVEFSDEEVQKDIDSSLNSTRNSARIRIRR